MPLLLFNVYVSDLAANQHGTSLPSFADDMSMYCSHSTPEEACQVVSRAISMKRSRNESRQNRFNDYVLHSLRLCLCLLVDQLNL